MAPDEILQAQQIEWLFNQLNRSVLLVNPEAQVVYLNPSAERLWGQSWESARFRPIEEALPEGEKLAPLIYEVLHTGRSLKVHEFELHSPGGGLFLEIELAPIGSWESPSGVLLILGELSVLQALQEENRVTDRLSMMGTLASGLAHEIRNPLGGIRAAAEMLVREAENAEGREYAGMIIAEVDRVNVLVGQLLDFSKPKKRKKQRININQMLDELLTLQEPQLKKNAIKLRHEFDPSLPPVVGDPGSLKQALLNLLKNAVEAMEGGGSLKVSTGFFSDYHLVLGENRARHMALIKISDTGPGIKPEHMQALFTPFFTTKPKGTGLGLMITQRIIKEHEGLLRIKTELKKGSSFQVYLKLAL